MSKHNIPDEEIPNSEPPPSYEESLGLGSSSQPPPLTPQFQPPPQRVQQQQNYQNQPPPQPQRPLSQNPQFMGSNTGNYLNQLTPADLYSNNPALPFQYPKGHFCKKCKNTGFKDSEKPCKHCWDKFYRDRVYNPKPQLGLRYPKGFICSKCANTGTKRKNGRTCTDCFERYGPRNRVQSIPLPYGVQNIVAQAMAPFMSPMGPLGGTGGPPVQLLPGDPRLGGMLCAKCKGSGQVSFFLDTEICPLCGGLGRIVNVQQSGYY